MKYYVVNSFECGPHTGNPAGVVPMDESIPNDVRQAVAFENGLSETAFIMKKGDEWDISWFTPTTEVGFCGHATLGAAFVIFNFIEPDAEKITFRSHIDGLAYCERDGDRLYIDFPARGLKEMELRPELDEALGYKVQSLMQNVEKPAEVFALVDSEETVAGLEPDNDKLSKVEGIAAVSVMASGTDTDYVCRFFAPGIGIPEDPVTGSIEMCMIPFWREKLGKDELTCRQLSKRGGLKALKYKGDRVSVGGRARLYLEGEITVE